MMYPIRIAISLSVAAALVCAAMTAGCSEPAKRLNAPPQGHTAYPHEMQQHYVPMVDNALLADMSMSSSDFVPHQSELNTKGVRRLSRYVSILKTYGGELNYDGVDDETPLADDRVSRIESFLVAAGVERDQFKVGKGLAGGQGMDAKEAIAVRDDSRFKPSKAGGNQGAPPGAQAQTGK